jgi:hypothetical protein
MLELDVWLFCKSVTHAHAHAHAHAYALKKKSSTQVAHEQLQTKAEEKDLVDIKAQAASAADAAMRTQTDFTAFQVQDPNIILYRLDSYRLM